MYSAVSTPSTWGDVRVSSIYAGLIATDLGTKPNVAAKGGRLIDPSRLPQPEDVAAVVSWLADPPPGACVSELTLESTPHPYPAVRRAQESWVERASPVPKL
eukprot:NODE_8675_length_399_cov_25.065714_g7792_i0.p1 GENE.NODE_8675_length_399_cov_25.065714_g7792_i0~~NODE_8675_length_399_cov_25.065714_g7792_i0.p1  ORF type:complete len:102 (+),score=33.90 NODE_8675_length_399_cov_25.065714_g7792_i0:32-337(+)